MSRNPGLVENLIKAAKEYRDIVPSQHKYPHETYQKLISALSAIEVEEKDLLEAEKSSTMDIVGR